MRRGTSSFDDRLRPEMDALVRGLTTAVVELVRRHVTDVLLGGVGVSSKPKRRPGPKPGRRKVRKKRGRKRKAKRRT